MAGGAGNLSSKASITLTLQSLIYNGFNPLLAPPKAEIARNQRATLEYTVGGNVTLSVNVTIFNIPLISISWAHEGNTLTGDEDRVNIQTSAMLPVSSGSVTSTLQIRAAVLEDAGYYNATVTSSTKRSVVHFEMAVTSSTERSVVHFEMAGT